MNLRQYCQKCKMVEPIIEKMEGFICGNCRVLFEELTQQGLQKTKKFYQGWRHTITCKDCKDEIYSKTSGEYTSCSCGKHAIDETTQYCRVIGNFTNDQFDRRQISELDKELKNERS